MMRDLNPLGPGISPVAIHTGAPSFMVGGMALKATGGSAIVKVRPGCPKENQKNG